MSSGAQKNKRFGLPLMLAFRDAFRERDAKRAPDRTRPEGRPALVSRRSLRASATETQLRSQLSRDLETLMNTFNLGSSIDLHSCESVAKSIVNFGLHDMSHRTIEENRTERVRDEIRQAILHFEPRLIRKSVKVTRDTTVEGASLNMGFLIEAQMSCDPVAIPVEFIADLEISSGRLAITKR